MSGFKRLHNIDYNHINSTINANSKIGKISTYFTFKLKKHNKHS